MRHFIYKMVYKKSPKYGFCCYCQVKAKDVLKVVQVLHVFRYRHTNNKMVSNKMVLFDKTVTVLMMAPMMAHSDALSPLETRNPVPKLSSRKVLHTNASPAAVYSFRELPMVEKLTKLFHSMRRKWAIT